MSKCRLLFMGSSGVSGVIRGDKKYFLFSGQKKRNVVKCSLFICLSGKKCFR